MNSNKGFCQLAKNLQLCDSFCWIKIFDEKEHWIVCFFNEKITQNILKMPSFLTWWSIFSVMFDVVWPMIRWLKAFHSLYYQSSEIFPSFICALIETPIMQMCSKALKFRQRKFAIFTLRYLDTKTVGLFEGSFFLGGIWLPTSCIKKN